MTFPPVKGKMSENFEVQRAWSSLWRWRTEVNEGIESVDLIKGLLLMEAL